MFETTNFIVNLILLSNQVFILILSWAMAVTGTPGHTLTDLFHRYYDGDDDDDDNNNNNNKP
jgi:hypothetical protein